MRSLSLAPKADREPEQKAEPVERRHPSERSGPSHPKAGSSHGRSERRAAARGFSRRTRAAAKIVRPLLAIGSSSARPGSQGLAQELGEHSCFEGCGCPRQPPRIAHSVRSPTCEGVNGCAVIKRAHPLRALLLGQRTDWLRGWWAAWAESAPLEVVSERTGVRAKAVISATIATASATTTTRQPAITDRLVGRRAPAFPSRPRPRERSGWPESRTRSVCRFRHGQDERALHDHHSRRPGRRGPHWGR